MVYLFKCNNPLCDEHEKELEKDIPMKDYDSIVPTLVCHNCSGKLVRVYTILGHSTFNDGWKG